jgi:hypothetical protein
VKRRKLANGKVNIVGAFGVVTGIHVGFFRYVSNRGKPHVLRVNGLTADDYFGVIRDSASRVRFINRAALGFREDAAYTGSPSIISENSSCTVLTKQDLRRRDGIRAN